MKKTVLIFLYSITAYATPDGFDLVSGQASPPLIDAQGHIHIKSTEDSIVHWNSFSLNPQETLIFDQAQETSLILNRVIGSNPSEILGKLQSNGIIYLINPNGILIGPNGIVQSAGFLASTLDILNGEFLTKDTLELFSANPGSIINLGTISCPVGQITLLARNVDNQGELNGSVQALACTKATLQIDNQRVFIQTNQNLDNAEDLQNLHKSLHKNPYAHAIRHSGKITANTLGMKDGRVYLFAQNGTTDITGDIEAADVKLLGEEVLLREKAIVDASSNNQGGKIFIGGSYKGQDSTIPKSERVLIDAHVQLRADALESGNGGEIIIWSEKNTEYLGHLSAKGGTLAGNGGFSEVSGVEKLRFEGRVDLTAANGTTGHLLIDPENITIISSGTDPATGQIFNTPGNVNISGSEVGNALAAANLTLQANRDITIRDNIDSVNGNTLTLQAGGSITGLPDPASPDRLIISLNGGNFNAIFNSTGPIPEIGNLAVFSVNRFEIVTLGPGPAGDINIEQGSLAGSFLGTIILNGCVLNAGSLQLYINPANNLASATGIILNQTRVDAEQVTLNGTGMQGGVNLTGSTINNQGITINGTTTGTSPGILLNNSGIQTTSGNVVLNAQGLDDSSSGILMNNQAIISALNGSVTLDSSRGSIELNGGQVFCGGSGLLTVNTSTDCILSATAQPSRMLINTGLASFSVGRDLILTSGTGTQGNAIIGTNNPSFTGGSLEFNVGRNVSIQAVGSENYSLIGYGDPSNLHNVSGDILFTHVGGDIVVEGSTGLGERGFAQIGHLGGENSTLNGNIFLTTEGSISVIGGSASTSSYAQIGHGGDASFTTTGDLTAIAGKNLIMQSGTAPANIINAGGNLTLVVDNLFPASPLIGPGFFSIQSNLSARDQLRIYTSIRSQNQINDLINGVSFIPGTIFVNSDQETWATYYPGGGYVGPFMIYYKDGIFEGAEGAFQFSVDNSELSRYLPIVRHPIYQANLEYFSLQELFCFDPYRRVLRYRTDQRNLTK